MRGSVRERVLLLLVARRAEGLVGSGLRRGVCCRHSVDRPRPRARAQRVAADDHATGEPEQSSEELVAGAALVGQLLGFVDLSDAPACESLVPWWARGRACGMEPRP